MSTATAQAPPASVTDTWTGERSYTYPPTGEQLDSVTTVIGATDAKPWLTKWAGRVSMGFAVDNLLMLARTLFWEGRDAAIGLGKDEAQRLREVKADAGTYVHDVMEALILWAAETSRGDLVPLPVLPAHLEGASYDGEPLAGVVEAMVDGFIQFVADFDPQFLATEMPVYHYLLGFAGTLDMVIAITGYDLCAGVNCHLGAHCPGLWSHAVPAPGSLLPLCVDGKTGKEPEGTWKEQLAAYRRCPECRPDRMSDVLYPTPRTRAGAVLHLRREYPGGYCLMLVAGEDDEAAWGRFKAATRIYRERQQVKDKPGRALRPLRPDGTMPGPRLCDVAGEGWGRALAPLREALGAGCELEDLARFTAEEVLAIKGVGDKLLAGIRVMLADHGLALAGETPAAATTAKAA